MYLLLCSDKGYLVYILLAVLDHNHHVNRAFKQSSELEASNQGSDETRQFQSVATLVKSLGCHSHKS